MKMPQNNEFKKKNLNWKNWKNKSPIAEGGAIFTYLLHEMPPSFQGSKIFSVRTDPFLEFELKARSQKRDRGSISGVLETEREEWKIFLFYFWIWRANGRRKRWKREGEETPRRAFNGGGVDQKQFLNFQIQLPRDPRHVTERAAAASLAVGLLSTCRDFELPHQLMIWPRAASGAMLALWRTAFESGSFERRGHVAASVVSRNPTLNGFDSGGCRGGWNPHFSPGSYQNNHGNINANVE